MNSIGKILVVFVTASSLGFLAFVMALRNGGPDWKGEMRSADLQKEFVFTIEPGENVTYSAKYRRADSSVVDKTPILAEVVLKSRKKLEDETNKKFQELTPQLQPLMDFLALQKSLIPIDEAGVQARFKKIEERIQQISAELKNLGDKFSATTVQTQDVMRVVSERREEAYRLANQLELLRNDKFSAAQQQTILEGELIRLEENRRRLEHRREQLKKQLGDKDKYDEPST